MTDIWKRGSIIDPNEEPDQNLRPISKKEPWSLIDGIQWNQTRVIHASDETAVPMLKICIEPCAGIAPSEVASGNIYRLLTRYFPDGSVKEILIDFSEPHLDWQDYANDDDGEESVGTDTSDWEGV
jgi:hypothetical protein